MSLDWIKAELAALDERRLRRFLRRVGSPPGPVIRLEGREVINFSSNDYLGLAADRRVIAAAALAAEKFGAGAGSSRLIAGNLALFEDLEAALAAHKGAPAALLFNSGYQANLGLLPALVGPDDTVFSDRLNHASIIDGCRLSRARVQVFEHNDLEHLDRLLAADRSRRRLIVTESLFSMDGDLAPLPDLVRLAAASGAMIAIDDAHAGGLLGPNGAGGLAHFGLPPDAADAVVGTLGKAFGSAGAFVAGSADLRALLCNRARSFIFTTAPAPAAAGAALEALRVAGEEPWRRERALALAARLRAGLSAMGYCLTASAAAIVPMILGSEAAALAASARLFDRGFLVSAIRPPTVPPGSSRLRITVTAGHTEEQVDDLISALAVDALTGAPTSACP